MKMIIFVLLISYSINTYSQFDSVSYKKITVENFKERFETDSDKIENYVYYKSKFLNDDLNYKTTLKCEIQKSKNFHIYLFSEYYGSGDWLFHTYLKLKIGEITKTTSKQEPSTRVTYDAYVNESCFFDTPNDILIIKWISENYDKDILVRFYGRDSYYDIKLSDKSKISIKETYELYLLLKSGKIK